MARPLIASPPRPHAATSCLRRPDHRPPQSPFLFHRARNTCHHHLLKPVSAMQTTAATLTTFITLSPVLFLACRPRSSHHRPGHPSPASRHHHHSPSSCRPRTTTNHHCQSPITTRGGAQVACCAHCSTEKEHAYLCIENHEDALARPACSPATTRRRQPTTDHLPPSSIADDDQHGSAASAVLVDTEDSQTASAYTYTCT
ncbi:hypothetical protein Dimus_017648, partial [Dionaea muscipula]